MISFFQGIACAYWVDGTTIFTGLINRNDEEHRLCYTENMSSLYSDTHPKMEALQIQLWRQASPTQKMHMLAQLNASARLLALSGLRGQFPDASEAELKCKLAVLLLGEELARKVCGDNKIAK
ncbi:MAG TPA: hypothetical protein PKK59_11095 [Anaerolineaceae bacterium]|nr:hypothetical protein [Anaerolineaceae bacterium]